MISRILEYFGGKVVTLVSSRKEGAILYDSSLDPKTVQEHIKMIDAEVHITEEPDEHIILHRAANILCKTLLNINAVSQTLPLTLTSKHLKEGQATAPDLVKDFVIQVLSTQPSSPTELESRVAQSIADDLLYNTTKGHVKPAKHLLMGVGMKSMTGRKKRTVIFYINLVMPSLPHRGREL